MIDYSKVNRGDILRVVGAGAPGYVANGGLVRVLDVQQNRVTVERPDDGAKCDFVFNCGAARLEPTEWRNDFPCVQIWPKTHS